MDINALKTFLEVAKTRHFGQAADTLFVSQSTVSARIRALEEAVGAELFVRDRGNIRLTPAGQSMITHAKSMMTLWSRAKQEIASPDDPRQTIVFGGLSGLWDITLQNWLFAISKSHPKLALSADIFSAEALVTLVLDGTIDIAFLYDAPQSVSIQTKQLRPIKLRLVSSHPVTHLEDNWAEYFIKVDWGMSFAVQFAAEFPNVRASKLVTGLGRIAQEHLKLSKGYAYLAEPAVNHAIKEGQLFYVPDAPVFKRTAHAIFLQESDKVDLIQELIEPL